MQGADKRGLAAGQAGGGILPSGVGGEGQQAARTAAVWAEQRQARALRLVVAGEVLHILRPLAYTLALRRCGGRVVRGGSAGCCYCWCGSQPSGRVLQLLDPPSASSHQSLLG